MTPKLGTVEWWREAAWRLARQLEIEIPCDYCGVQNGECVVRGTDRQTPIRHVDRRVWVNQLMRGELDEK